MDPGKKLCFFQAIFRKISFFSDKFPKSFDFSKQISKTFRLLCKNFRMTFFSHLLQNFRLSREIRNLPFTAKFWANYSISLKSHHFRTYFLYMIGYNFVSRPPCKPHDPQLKFWGSRHDQPPGLTPMQFASSFLSPVNTIR